MGISEHEVAMMEKINTINHRYYGGFHYFNETQKVINTDDLRKRSKVFYQNEPYKVIRYDKEKSMVWIQNRKTRNRATVSAKELSTEKFYFGVMVMPKLEGETLYDLMRRGLSEAEITKIIVSLAVQLKVVHKEKGIVHRDIKPRNIMVNKGTAELFDWGIGATLSKEQNMGRYKFNSSLGPKAMCDSLEIDEDNRICEFTDEGDDWWQLIIVAFELFTGYYPLRTKRLKSKEYWTSILTKKPRRRSNLRNSKISVFELLISTLSSTLKNDDRARTGFELFQEWLHDKEKFPKELQMYLFPVSPKAQRPLTKHKDHRESNGKSISKKTAKKLTRMEYHDDLRQLQKDTDAEREKALASGKPTTKGTE